LGNHLTLISGLTAEKIYFGNKLKIHKNLFIYIHSFNSTQADINSTKDNQLKPVSILQKFASKLSLDENPIKKKNVLLIDIELQNYKTIINNTTLEFQEFWIEHEKLLPLLYTLAKKVF
jgi:hypothetical protein